MSFSRLLIGACLVLPACGASPGASAPDSTPVLAHPDSIAAAIIKPYVREECAWVCQHHGIFQLVYYAHFQGGDPEIRERYSDHPYYQAAVDFCERWDQASFDPNYETLALSHFAPMVHEVFAREPWAGDHLCLGQQAPLYKA